VTRLAQVALLTVSVAVATSARAAPAPPIDAPVVTLTAAPIFGAEAANGNGWSEIAVRVDDVGPSAAKGTLELSTTQGFGGNVELATRAPFAVPAGRSAIVLMPLHPYSPWYPPQVTLIAKSDAGTKLASASVTIDTAASPLLVEIAQPARLAVALRGWTVPTGWSPTGSGSPANPPAISVGAPEVDRTTGDPILPDRAVGYASVSAIVVRSDRLVLLDEVRQAALVDWVEGGGTIGVAITRPEDLRAPIVTTLVGGEASKAMPPARLFTLPAFDKPAPEPLDAPAPGEPAQAQRPSHVGPSAALAAKLAGYDGARLHASDFGATAPFGLGEVHLLAFDPSGPVALGDPWAATRVVAMVGRAWDRRSRIALPEGGGDRSTARLEDVRRALDPNESFRLGLAVSTALLVLYAIVVGPLVFGRATKRAAPLLPLRWVPVWSAAAFFAIVVIGLGVKGWRGRARHLTFLEAGSGAARAAARGYRGFFASETRSLRVATSDRASVLSMAATDSLLRGAPGVLDLDAAGATLSNLTSLPWQTVVVREDAHASIGAGVVLAQTAAGAYTVENRSGHVLKDVLVHAPKQDVVYFSTIDDGQKVEVERGRVLPRVGMMGVAGSHHVRSLGTDQIAGAMGGRDGRRVAETWKPIESAAGSNIVDWWPEDAIALLGEIVGGSHATRDAGLVLESDRTLLRVVGEASP